MTKYFGMTVSLFLQIKLELTTIILNEGRESI